MDRIEFPKPLQLLKDELLAIYKGINKTKGTNEQLTEIFFQFLIHRNLTQKELHQLTGASKGFISESLRYFTNYNVVERQIIKGTNKSEYFLRTNFTGMASILMQEMQADIRQLQSYYHTKLGQLLQVKEEPGSNTQELIQSLKRVLMFLDQYESATSKLGSALRDDNEDLHHGVNPSPEYDEQFTLQLSELITRFAESKIVPYNRTSQRKLYGAMLFLQEFTKQDLKKATNMSYKTLNEHFTFFEEKRNLMTKIPDTNPPRYLLKSIDQIMDQNVSATGTELMKKKNILRMKEIQTELEAQRDILQVHNGYDQILTFIKDYFEIMAKMTASLLGK